MRKSILTLVAMIMLIIPMLAACGSQPAAQPTAVPAEEATTAPEPAEEPTADATEEPAEEPTADATEEPAEEPTEEPAEEPASTDPSAFRVALVTDLGRVNDGTFNEFAHNGVLQAQATYDFEYKFIETVSEADYVANLQTFIDEGFNIIVTVGFLIQDATVAAAADNPEIYFIGVDQFYEPGTVTDNLLGLQFREDQAGFLAGALAAMMSETGTIGIVAGVEIPPVKKFKHGFDNGARYVRPDINLLGVYLPTFIDPALGASTAELQIGADADVIFGAGGPTGSGAIKAAAEQGAFVIGVDQDEFVTTFSNGDAPGADRILSSAIKRVDVAVADAISNVINGTFEGNGIAVYDAAGDGIGLASFNLTADLIPESVQAKLDEIFAALADGTLSTGVDPASGDLIEDEIPEPNPFTP
ncbi:BMP family ABC transporter substrate-binding protein [Candidatus Viridilinea mediisalina]|uniref:BMP family ABC transporter substrate-binding protein n=1 Tax=Candidatus Viridilinea mediisalina TaxID=2024553 RepID=A0A2A6RLS7_9CHLR|nr:BMP family ABC transporter substrate-binding protein [Candidatus Viridilinea mediisalina]PDW03818.1 BMP family ABC transporter substrate-binding protein [Candidatus Viridilinea mediisalina]